jgi:hypothetical protein
MERRVGDIVLSPTPASGQTTRTKMGAYPTARIQPRGAPREKLAEPPPVPQLVVWIFVALICAAALLALKVYFDIFPPPYTPSGGFRTWFHRKSHPHRRKERGNQCGGESRFVDGRETDTTRCASKLTSQTSTAFPAAKGADVLPDSPSNSGASLYDLPLPFCGASSPPTPITPSWTAASGFCPPTNTPIRAGFGINSTPGTPYEDMFPSIERGNTSLRHRHHATPLQGPTPNIDLESLVPTPMPSPLTPSFAHYMLNPKSTSTEAFPKSGRYDPARKSSSFLVRSVDALVDKVSRYTADSGGEDGLLLPISMAEREEADRFSI